MKVALFDFAPDLQLLLKRDLRGKPVELRFQGPQSVKHLIESLGIPHTEIGALYADGREIGLDYITQGGDRIEVRPVAPADLTDEPRFVLDGHLGRLASHLRMLGLDCLYDNAYEDDELVRISVEDRHILLTRDRLLLMHKVISQGYLLRSLNSTEQLYEVIQRYRLVKWVRPFQRCMNCNHLLEPVEKEMVLEKLEPLTKKYYDEFKFCPACDQVYWKGSHYERMLQLIEEVSNKTS
ncbi:MAG: Mut7-C ubiquitin/RNAse domain-containing protein [Anaerolineales bacterium]|nr:Mut7-C ubiquitin/RNAse domain-containing protein [Anaerolineales bacterium]